VASDILLIRKFLVHQTVLFQRSKINSVFFEKRQKQRLFIFFYFKLIPFTILRRVRDTSKSLYYEY